MKKYIYLVMVALGILTLASCSENEPMAYEGQPALYFANDDINFSFFYAESAGDRSSVDITVHAMGPVSDVDRAFTLYQENAGEADAAQSGVHYLGFDTDEMKQAMVIPAGKSEIKLPIVLLKDNSLDTKTVKLKIGIRPNENFGKGVVEKDSTVISFSSQAMKPANWKDWYYAFGASWGTVKMRFIIDVTGITNFDQVPEDYDYLIYLNGKLKSKLFEYNSTHEQPLQEVDGTLVEFENPYIWE